MVITSTPRRLHMLPTATDPLSLPHCPTSPVSMRYSVQGCGKQGIVGETSSHHSIAETETRQIDMKTINWSMRMFLAMTICSALFSVISLQFYYANGEKFRGKPGNHLNYITILRDIISSFDIAIVVCSLATFFTSSIQLLFLIKIVRYQGTNTGIALEYVHYTNFLRVVAYSFWFGSIVAFIIIILLSCAIDPARSLASKCVAITLGASAILLCIWISFKTLYFWGRLSYGHIYKDNFYNHLSTLV